MADAALQRMNMVESQVRPSDVTDRRITAGMQKLARESFVPEALRPIAYMDEALEIAPGRAMLAPRTLAKKVQLAGIKESDRVLVVGAMTGYTAALVAGLSSAVVALESEQGLAELARKNLEKLGRHNVEVAVGALEAGVPVKAPFDVIFIEGEVEEIPETLFEQLAQEGRLVAIAAGETGVSEAFVIIKSGARPSRRNAFEASGSKLKGFFKPRKFSF